MDFPAKVIYLYAPASQALLTLCIPILNLEKMLAEAGQIA
jgi:hypothetical protein